MSLTLFHQVLPKKINKVKKNQYLSSWHVFLFLTNRFQSFEKLCMHFFISYILNCCAGREAQSRLCLCAKEELGILWRQQRDDFDNQENDYFTLFISMTGRNLKQSNIRVRSLKGWQKNLHYIGLSFHLPTNTKDFKLLN